MGLNNLKRFLNTSNPFFNLFFILLFSFLSPSCGNKETAASLNEGVIEFESKAVDEKHPLAMLIPGTATLKYKNEKFVMEMSTMGFKTCIYGDRNAKTMIQTIKFLDIKEACLEKEADIKKEKDGYKLKIEETNETKQIAGFKCYKLKVTMVDSPAVTFNAYYTKDLGMGDFNELTPYAAVKGVLMDYRAKRMGAEVRFLAKSVKNIAIEDNEFVIPTDVKFVSKEALEKTINLD